MDMFAVRYCSKNNTAFGEMGVEGGMGEALEALLRARARDTFSATVRSAPEEVRRGVGARQQYHIQQQHHGQHQQQHVLY